MNTLVLIPSLLTFHFVADFVFQTDWMAKNKSTNPYALTAHAALYSLILTFGAIWIGMSVAYQALFFGITFVSHFVTDFFTSKWTKRLFGDWHWFFVVVGLDQLIHVWSLTLTVLYIKS